MSAVEQLEALLKDQPANPLRPNQVEGFKEEQRRLDAIVHAPQYVPGDRTTAFRRSIQIKETLDQQAPKPITDGVRAAQVHRLAREVLETVVRPAMLSRAVMRRNPGGAVDAFIRRENAPTVKRGKLAWKRAMWALDPTNDSRDHTNLELHRPEGGGETTSSFMVDAQIPGHFAMSPQAKENWPLGDPTSQTAVSHLKEELDLSAHPVRETIPPRGEDEPEVLPCECGCGSMMRNPGKKRYVNKSHRVRASLLRRKRAMEEKPPVNLAPRAPDAGEPPQE